MSVMPKKWAQHMEKVVREAWEAGFDQCRSGEENSFKWDEAWSKISPTAKKTSPSKNKDTSSSDKERSLLPYDSCKCQARAWGGGYGVQCKSNPKEGCEGLCGTHFKQLEAARREGGSDIRNGRYNQPKPWASLDVPEGHKKYELFCWLDPSSILIPKASTKEMRLKLVELGFSSELANSLKGKNLTNRYNEEMAKAGVSEKEESTPPPESPKSASDDGSGVFPSESQDSPEDPEPEVPEPEETTGFFPPPPLIMTTCWGCMDSEILRENIHTVETPEGVKEYCSSCKIKYHQNVLIEKKVEEIEEKIDETSQSPKKVAEFKKWFLANGIPVDNIKGKKALHEKYNEEKLRIKQEKEEAKRLAAEAAEKVEAEKAEAEKAEAEKAEAEKAEAEKAEAEKAEAEKAEAEKAEGESENAEQAPGSLGKDESSDSDGEETEDMSDEEGGPTLEKTSFDGVEYLEDEDTEELFCPITNKLMGTWNDEGGINWANTDARDKHEMRRNSK
jgi:murein DD-endopeptidase MepM/ murein hydrolase activator NlpD